MSTSLILVNGWEMTVNFICLDKNYFYALLDFVTILIIIAKVKFRGQGLSLW